MALCKAKVALADKIRIYPNAYKSAPNKIYLVFFILLYFFYYKFKKIKPYLFVKCML